MFFNATRYTSLSNSGISFLDPIRKNRYLLNIFEKMYVINHNASSLYELKKSKSKWSSYVSAFFHYKCYKYFLGLHSLNSKSFVFSLLKENLLLKTSLNITEFVFNPNNFEKFTSISVSPYSLFKLKDSKILPLTFHLLAYKNIMFFKDKKVLPLIHKYSHKRLKNLNRSFKKSLSLSSYDFIYNSNSLWKKKPLVNNYLKKFNYAQNRLKNLTSKHTQRHFFLDWIKKRFSNIVLNVNSVSSMVKSKNFFDRLYSKKSLNSKPYVISITSYKNAIQRSFVCRGKISKRLWKSLYLHNTKVSKFTLTALKLNLLINTNINFRDKLKLTDTPQFYSKLKFNTNINFVIGKTLALSNYYILSTSIKRRPFMRKLIKDIVWNICHKRALFRKRYRKDKFSLVKSLSKKPWLSYFGSTKQKEWKRKKKSKKFEFSFFKSLKSNGNNPVVASDVFYKNKIEPMIWNSFKNKEKLGFKHYNKILKQFSDVERLKRIKRKYFLNINSKVNPNFFIKKRETTKFKYKNTMKYKNKTKWFDFIFNEYLAPKRYLKLDYDADRYRLKAPLRKNFYVQHNRTLRGGRWRKNRFRDKIIRNIHTYTTRFTGLTWREGKNTELTNSYFFTSEGQYLLHDFGELSFNVPTVKDKCLIKSFFTPYVKVFSANQFRDFSITEFNSSVKSKINKNFDVKLLYNFTIFKKFSFRSFSLIKKNYKTVNTFLWKVLSENKLLHITKFGLLFFRRQFNFIRRKIKKRFNFNKVKCFKNNMKKFNNMILHKNTQLNLLHNNYISSLNYFMPKNNFYLAGAKLANMVDTKAFLYKLMGPSRSFSSKMFKLSSIVKINQESYTLKDKTFLNMKKKLFIRNFRIDVLSQIKNLYYQKLFNYNSKRLIIWSKVSRPYVKNLFNNIFTTRFRLFKYIGRYTGNILYKNKSLLAFNIKRKLKRFQRFLFFKNISFRKNRTRKQRTSFKSNSSLLQVPKRKKKDVTRIKKKSIMFFKSRYLDVKLSTNYLFATYLSLEDTNQVNFKKKFKSVLNTFTSPKNYTELFFKRLKFSKKKFLRYTDSIKFFRFNKKIVLKAKKNTVITLSKINKTWVTGWHSSPPAEYIRYTKRRAYSKFGRKLVVFKSLRIYNRFSRRQLVLQPLFYSRKLKKFLRLHYRLKTYKNVAKKKHRGWFRRFSKAQLRLKGSARFLNSFMLMRNSRFFTVQNKKNSTNSLLNRFLFSKHVFLKKLKVSNQCITKYHLSENVRTISKLLISFKKLYDKQTLICKIYRTRAYLLKSTVLTNFVYKSVWLENYKDFIPTTLRFYRSVYTYSKINFISKLNTKNIYAKINYFFVLSNFIPNKSFLKDIDLNFIKTLLISFTLISLSRWKLKIKVDNLKVRLTQSFKWTNFNQTLLNFKFLSNPRPSLLPTDFLVKRGLLIEPSEISFYQNKGYLVSRTKTSFILSSTGFFLLSNPPHYSQREEISPLILTSKYYLFWEPNDYKRQILNRVLRRYISIRKPLLNKFWSYNSRPGSITHDFEDVNIKKYEKKARQYVPHKAKKLLRSNTRLSQKLDNRYTTYNTTFSNFFNFSDTKMFNIFNTSMSHDRTNDRFYYHQKSRDYWNYTFHKKLDLRVQKFTGKRPRRWKFKPGIQRILRKRRTEFRDQYQIRWFYEHRLTTHLGTLEGINFRNINTTLQNDNTQLYLAQVLLYSKFLPDTDSVATAIKSKAVAINGYFTSKLHSMVILNDFIQMIIHAKYYIIYKWIINWSFKVVNRIAKMNKRRPIYRKVGLFKKKSHRIPNWIYNYRNKYRFYDIYRYLEVDYFTLSSFVIYDPWRSAQKQTHTEPYRFRTRIVRLYNWRYIT